MSTYATGTTIPPAPPTGAAVYAGFWIRVLAVVIDGVIFFGFSFLYTLMTGGNVQSSVDPSGKLSFSFNTTSSVPFLVGLLYTIGFWVYAGATPGKMLLRLRIVRADTGAPISIGQAIGRYFAYILSGIVFGLGFVWAAFDGRKQTWHDKLASTVVVRNPPNAVVFRG